jgi:hypothetical protein
VSRRLISVWSMTAIGAIEPLSRVEPSAYCWIASGPVAYKVPGYSGKGDAASGCGEAMSMAFPAF